jgi:prepilin-type processing-associated H-X9-DG protein
MHGQVWVQLGSGKKPHPNLINVEGVLGRGQQMWLDLRHGLPFPTNSVDGIYASHVLEHFFSAELLDLLRDCVRVLRKGGGIRILVPDVECAINAYRERALDRLPNWPMSSTTVGGRLINFLFCDGQHRLGFDFEFAQEILARTKFRQVVRQSPRSSRIFEEAVVRELEPPTYEIETSLVVEAFT